MNAFTAIATTSTAAPARGRRIVPMVNVLVATTARGRQIGWIEVPTASDRSKSFRTWAAGQGATKFVVRSVPTGPCGPQV